MLIVSDYRRTALEACNDSNTEVCSLHNWLNRTQNLSSSMVGKKSSILDTLNLTRLCDTQMIMFRAENLRLKREVLCGYFIKLLMPTAVTSELKVT